MHTCSIQLLTAPAVIYAVYTVGAQTNIRTYSYLIGNSNAGWDGGRETFKLTYIFQAHHEFLNTKVIYEAILVELCNE